MRDVSITLADRVGVEKQDIENQAPLIFNVVLGEELGTYEASEPSFKMTPALLSHIASARCFCPSPRGTRIDKRRLIRKKTVVRKIAVVRGNALSGAADTQ